MPTCGTSARWSAANGASKKFGKFCFSPKWGGIFASFRRKKKFFKKTENNACILFVLVVLYRSRRENGKQNIRVWRSLVSRLNGVQEASSSNLDTRTIRPKEGMLFRSYFLSRNHPSTYVLRLPFWGSCHEVTKERRNPFRFRAPAREISSPSSVTALPCHLPPREGKDCATRTGTVPGSAGHFRNPPRLPSGAAGAPPADPQCQNPLEAAGAETLPVGG